jgi:cardiolipin synthase
MFHPKSMVVDGIFSTIGSTNFDNRSFRLNDELNLTVYDTEFAAALEASFRRDLTRSRPYTYAQWLDRGVLERAFEWAVLPFRSQL